MSSAWTDEDVEGLLRSLAIACIVAGIGYYLSLPRRLDQGTAGGQPLPAQPQQNRDRTEGNPAQRRRGSTQNRNDDDNDDTDGIDYLLKRHSRLPPHHVDMSSDAVPTHDGIVPFRCTKASTFESRSIDASQTLEHRKERARIFAKLFAANKMNPPMRGRTLVISIKNDDSQNEKLQRVLYLLGSYYNLFLMVTLDEADHMGNYIDDKERSSNIISVFYSSGIIQKQVIPPHRIVVTRSTASRVAFVRAFPRSPDYVIGSTDENELSDQLSKFGFNVVLSSLLTLL